MPPLIYHVAVTLDGFLCRPDGRFDCFAQTGEHVDDYLAELTTYGSVLMGRKTWEVGLAFGVTNPYPHLKSYIVSHSMTQSPDPAVALCRDPVALVRSLREDDGGPIYLCGGGELASTLFAHELVDEVVLKVSPVLIGQGRPLVAGLPRDVALTRLAAKVYDRGVVVSRYAVLRS